MIRSLVLVLISLFAAGLGAGPAFAGTADQVAIPSVPRGGVAPVGADYDGYNLVIENGIIGIARVRAMFQVRNVSGTFDLVIVADETGLVELSLAMKSLDRPVLAEVRGTSLKAWLRAHPGCTALYGHLEGSSKRVFVVPTSSVRRC